MEEPIVDMFRNVGRGGPPQSGLVARRRLIRSPRSVGVMMECCAGLRPTFIFSLLHASMLATGRDASGSQACLLAQTHGPWLATLPFRCHRQEALSLLRLRRPQRQHQSSPLIRAPHSHPAMSMRHPTRLATPESGLARVQRYGESLRPGSSDLDASILTRHASLNNDSRSAVLRVMPQKSGAIAKILATTASGESYHASLKAVARREVNTQT